MLGETGEDDDEEDDEEGEGRDCEEEEEEEEEDERAHWEDGSERDRTRWGRALQRPACLLICL